MQAAKQAVSEFLHHGNKHSVEIEQETKPAVVHETVVEKQHEDVVQAIDRDVHQHHHQIHVQPIQDKVVEEERHHHNVIPIEKRTIHHGKDEKIQTALAAQYGKFKNEQEVLPVETTNQHNVVVGEHVHHHIHDHIQPVIERERVVPHVVHTTVPIHEHIEHEPYIHKGNVLPAMTLEEFNKTGYSLNGSRATTEHIDYEGKPLQIDGNSHVGFGTSGVLGNQQHSGSHHETGATATAGTAAATAAAANAYTHSSKHKNSRRDSVSSSSSDEEEENSSIPRSMSSKSKEKKSHSWLNKLNPKAHTTTTTTTQNV